MMESIKSKFGHLTQAIAAAMLATVFFTFLLQIFSRYVLNLPFSWTLELCLTLWVWIVFFGNAFILREEDQVRFDILYRAVPGGIRRIFALVTAAAVAGAMIWAFLPTWEYIDFLKIRKSAILKIPMNYVFAVYALFMIAVAARYAVRFVKTILKGPPPKTHISGIEVSPEENGNPS